MYTPHSHVHTPSIGAHTYNNCTSYSYHVPVGMLEVPFIVSTSHSQVCDFVHMHIPFHKFLPCTQAYTPFTCTHPIHRYTHHPQVHTPFITAHPVNIAHILHRYTPPFTGAYPVHICTSYSHVHTPFRGAHPVHPCTHFSQVHT